MKVPDDDPELRRFTEEWADWAASALRMSHIDPPDIEKFKASCQLTEGDNAREVLRAAIARFTSGSGVSLDELLGETPPEPDSPEGA